MPKDRFGFDESRVIIVIRCIPWTPRESYPAVSRLRLSYLNRRLRLLHRETTKTTPRSCSPFLYRMQETRDGRTNRCKTDRGGGKNVGFHGNHDFLEDPNRKRFFEYRSIDRFFGENAVNISIWNWLIGKSGKVGFAWVDLSKRRRFERCNLTGNQLAMKGWYKKTG